MAGVATLVHECVHVWQFQFGGTFYIGQSVLAQTLFKFGLIRKSYFWDEQIGTTPNSWYLLENVEAQAEFITDLFRHGRFIPTDGAPDESDGAFFNTSMNGMNEFTFTRGTDGIGTDTGMDFTPIANEAWRILSTG